MEKEGNQTETPRRNPVERFSNRTPEVTRHVSPTAGQATQSQLNELGELLMLRLGAITPQGTIDWPVVARYVEKELLGSDDGVDPLSFTAGELARVITDIRKRYPNEIPRQPFQKTRKRGLFGRGRGID